MISRHSLPIGFTICLFSCVLLASALTPATSHAFNPYEITNQTQGDPGDGVLSPRVDTGGGGSPGIVGNNQPTGPWHNTWRMPGGHWEWAIYLPGYGVITFVLPSAPSTEGVSAPGNGRSHHAR